MIKIYTGSHYLNKERNRQAFKELNTLLLSNKNPHQELFQTEELFLDDTDGFISIIPSCREAFYSKENKVTYKDLRELAWFIFDNVNCDEDLYVYIGGDLFIH